MKKKPEARRVSDYRRLGAPHIIKKGIILPTTCRLCHTVYQAKWRHILIDEELTHTPSRREHLTRCPACQALNYVEFANREEVSEG